MSARIIEAISGKKVMILGFGREGKSTYNAIRSLLPLYPLTLADKNPEVFDDPVLTRDDHLDLHTGDSYMDRVNDYDLIIKTPGISLNVFPGTVDRNRITSQTDIFIREHRSQIIGVTGTKGKSTTSSLIYHLLRLNDPDVLLVGNIGFPPFDSLKDIGEGTKIVFELSSHQLEYMTVSPKYAVFLNIFPEHLDHYITYERYQEAKLNILRYQEAGDWLVYNADDLNMASLFSRLIIRGNRLPFSAAGPLDDGACLDDQYFWFSIEGKRTRVMHLKTKRRLKGHHNDLNIMAAICICELFGLTPSQFRTGISTFKPLEHRMEYVGKYHDIHFYNDSIATIPEATMAAISALNDVETLILGGKDRGIDYRELISFLAVSKVRNIIFIGDAGRRIFEGYRQKNSGQTLYMADDFTVAVETAVRLTTAGMTCLLSPAAASYDWFTNFEERGMMFKKLVRMIR